MHTLYTAADPIEAEILRCYLAEHGIASRILGAGLWSAVGELPVDCGPRLVLDSECQLPAARELLRRYEHRRHAGASWLCACGERSPLHFEVCWNCGGEPVPAR